MGPASCPVPFPSCWEGGDVLVVGLHEVEQTGRTKQGLNQNQKVPSLKASAQEDSSQGAAQALREGKSCAGALESAQGGSSCLSGVEENLQLIAAGPFWPRLQVCSCEGARGAKTNLSRPWVCSCTWACTLCSHQGFSLG